MKLDANNGWFQDAKVHKNQNWNFARTKVKIFFFSILSGLMIFFGIFTTSCTNKKISNTKLIKPFTLNHIVNGELISISLDTSTGLIKTKVYCQNSKWLKSESFTYFDGRVYIKYYNYNGLGSKKKPFDIEVDYCQSDSNLAHLYEYMRPDYFHFNLYNDESVSVVKGVGNRRKYFSVLDSNGRFVEMR